MGLFDQSVDDDGVNLAPVPALDPSVLPPGLLQGMVPPMGPQMPRPVMPQAPQAPQAPGAMQHILSAALLGLAAGLGPSHGGTGGIAGLQRGQDANADARQQEFHNRQAQFKEQQAEAIRQQQMADREAQIAATAQAKRLQNLQQALTSIQADVKTLPDKATYDQRMDGYANLLQGSGYRIDANRLRMMVPFIAPTQKKRAQDAAAAFFKNPMNAAMLKNNPEAAATASIQFDANDDGIAENIPVKTLLDMAGMYVMTNDQGQPLTAAPSTDGPIQNLELKALIAKFRAENGREPNQGAEMAALIKTARTPVKAPKEPGDVPMMQVTDIDSDTGEIVTSLVPKKPGEISRKPPKEPNQGQFTAAGYANRMEQAESHLAKLEKDIAGMHTASFWAQSQLPAAAQTGVFQSYDQAARNFINAVLRRESGAAISTMEFADARRQYLPVPGDSPETLAQKKANRDLQFTNTRRSSGRAYEPLATVPNADDAVMAARKKGKP